MKISRLFHGNILTTEEPKIHEDNVFSLINATSHTDTSRSFINYKYSGKTNQACYQRLHTPGCLTPNGHNSFRPSYYNKQGGVHEVEIGDVVIMDQADCQQDFGSGQPKQFDWKSIVAVFNPEWNLPRPTGDYVMVRIDPELTRKKMTNLPENQLVLPMSSLSKGDSVANGSYITRPLAYVVDSGPGRYWKPNDKSTFVWSKPEFSVGEVVLLDTATRLDLIFRGTTYSFIRFPFISCIIEF